MGKIQFASLLAVAGMFTVSGNEKLSEEWNHECTSWIVMPDLTGGKQVLLHKNRDSTSRKIGLHKHSPAGKYTWLSVSNVPKLTSNMGLNEKGVAAVMNSGDSTDAVSKPSSWSTPAMAREILENSASAEAAVKALHELVKAKKCSHGGCGNIWIIADADSAFIVEHDALRFAAHKITSGFAIRANCFHFPEMVIYSKWRPKSVASITRREYNVREHLFGNGSQYNEPVTVEKMNAASRINQIPDASPECYPLCGNITNSAATIVIDREFPGALSSIYAAFGPPRHTVYLPIPFLLDKIPSELANAAFSDAVFARFDAKRELLPQDKLAEFESTLNKRHADAVEKARAILKKGGSKTEAAKILCEAFRLNWEAARKLSEGK